MRDGADNLRNFIGAALGAGSGLILASYLGGVVEKAGEAPATGDLMREHGVLDRSLLVYEEIIRRLEAREELDPELLAGTADIVRRFIQDNHEKAEEEYLFPRFEKAGRLVELVETLRTQHQAGRRITQRIRQLSTLAALRDPGQKREIINSIQAFMRMYRPHSAHEDTVLFPAFRKIVSKHEFDDIREGMEQKEKTLFGGDGFGLYVDKVARIEEELGIHQLARFTP